jgi:hypothetical protein
VSLHVGEPLDVGSPADVVTATRLLGATLQGMLDRLQAEERHRPAPGVTAWWHPAHLSGDALTVEEAEGLQDVPRTAVPPTWHPGAPDPLTRPRT